MQRPDAGSVGRLRFTGRLGFLFLLLVTLAACAPQIAPPGPGLTAKGFAGPALTDDSFITTDGTELPLRHWSPPQDLTAHGVVLALHGFNDYSNAFAESGPALAAKGLQVYAYDQRGFGEAPHTGLWAGTAALTGDLATAAALLQVRHPDLPLYLLGESMGGAVILAALAGPQPPTADGIILAAPAVWARSTMPFHLRAALWVGARLFPWARFSGRGLNIRASDNNEMLRDLGRDPLFIKKTRLGAVYGLVNLMDTALAAAPQIEAETLLLYGEKDQLVPMEPTFAFWRDLPPEAANRQRFALYENGWHMLLRDLQAQVVIDDIAAWTHDPAAALPSRADAHAAAFLGGDDPDSAAENASAAD